MNQVPEIKEGLQFTIPTGDRKTYSLKNVNYKDGVCQLQVEPEGRELSTPYGFEEVRRNIGTGNWNVVHIPPSNLSTLFSSQPHNVVMTALEECAKDFWKDGMYPEGFDGPVNSFIEWNTDPEALTKLIVDKIHQLGFTIIPK